MTGPGGAEGARWGGDAGGVSPEVTVSPALPAYRIHVNKSTVQILSALNEGFLTEVRGRTELKVRPGWKIRFHFDLERHRPSPQAA